MPFTPNNTPFSKTVQLTGFSLLVSVLMFSMPATAQVNESDLAELRSQIQMLSNRLAQLESENAEMATAIEVSQENDSASSWVNNVRITGDLRTRHENIDDSSKPSDRNRQRIRSRIGITAQIDENWKFGLGMAGGGDDPISTNQTLGSGANTKGFNLDYAYFEWSGLEDITVTGGKYRNVFFKPGGHNLIFDGDYRPEGMGMKYDNGAVFFNAATLLLESDDKASSQDKEFMWGMQLGYQIALNNDASLTLGGSYYNAAVSGSNPFYNNKSYSNTLDANGAYLYDYQEVELFAQLDFTVGNQPVRIFGDLVQNQDADNNDTGWALGAKYGNVSGPRTWEFRYIYQDLEADAVFGAMTDSDFGNSGTDSKGHIIDYAYGIGRNTELGLSYFINEYGEGSLGQAIDFNRLHLFMITSF